MRRERLLLAVGLALILLGWGFAELSLHQANARIRQLEHASGATGKIGCSGKFTSPETCCNFRDDAGNRFSFCAY